MDRLREGGNLGDMRGGWERKKEGGEGNKRDGGGMVGRGWR